MSKDLYINILSGICSPSLNNNIICFSYFLGFVQLAPRKVHRLPSTVLSRSLWKVSRGNISTIAGRSKPPTRHWMKSWQGNCGMSVWSSLELNIKREGFYA